MECLCEGGWLISSICIRAQRVAYDEVQSGERKLNVYHHIYRYKPKLSSSTVNSIVYTSSETQSLTT